MDNKGSVLSIERREREFAGFRFLTLIDKQTVDSRRLKWLWERMRECDESFDDFARNQIDYFIGMFESPANQFFTVGDDGLVILSNVIERGAAEIHYMTWNREWGPVRQKPVACELFDYVFFERKVHHLIGMIPSNNAVAIRFALSVGMRFEGQIRENFLYYGRYYATDIYGLLDREYTQVRGRLCRQE